MTRTRMMTILVVRSERVLAILDSKGISTSSSSSFFLMDFFLAGSLMMVSAASPSSVLAGVT